MADAVVSLEEVCAYIPIDYVDDDVKADINRMISTADRYLSGAVGENYPKDDARAKEIALIVISDLYQNRGTSTVITGNVKRMLDDMMWQLKLEMRCKDREL